MAKPKVKIKTLIEQARRVEPREKPLAAGLTMIYGLLDPRTGELRYIGQTKQPGRRKWLHESASNNKANRRLCAWVRSLLAESLKPVMIELEITEESDASEVGWIDFCKKRHARLVNANKGGLTLDHLHDMRGTLLEHKKTPLHKRLMQMSAMIKGLSAEAKAPFLEKRKEVDAAINRAIKREGKEVALARINAVLAARS